MPNASASAYGFRSRSRHNRRIVARIPSASRTRVPRRTDVVARSPSALRCLPGRFDRELFDISATVSLTCRIRRVLYDVFCEIARWRFDMAPLVTVRDLRKVYRRGSDQIHVLQGVSLDVPAGDFLALMGPSGSGKTTLLNLLGGLDRATGGTITVGDTHLDQISPRQLARWRARHVGFVFQLYNLLPTLTAERNVELPLLLRELPRSERRRRARTALRVVGLADRAKHHPRELSGGQEQRVGIARAIVTDPTLLLCDEPTGDLDRRSADEILELLHILNRDHGKTIVMVTHDPRAASVASRVLHLEKGQ